MYLSGSIPNTDKTQYVIMTEGLKKQQSGKCKR